MFKGYIWFAQNNSTTDYIELSKRLAISIKSYNQINKVCVITDRPVECKEFDYVKVLDKDHSKNQEWKMNNEWQVFKLSPFTHNIKLEADMLFTSNTDWWWNHLHQNNLVFSYNCRNYQDKTIKDTPYRELFKVNQLPNVYNGLTYFRRSIQAEQFFKICRTITLNWKEVSKKMLINCHAPEPTTDVVYALALKIMDPLQENKIEYDWFNFVHNKNAINNLSPVYNNDQYLNPIKVGNKTYVGGYRQDRIWHYYNKGLPKELDERDF